MRAQAATCKRGHVLAGANVWIGVQMKFCKRDGKFLAYPKRVCRLCRLRGDVDNRLLSRCQLSFANSGA